MQRAIAEMTLLALACSALGCWVVLFELSYAAESLAHSLFPGLVLAAIAGVPLLLGATPAIVLAALAVVLVARTTGVGRDLAVAIVVTTMFGLGVLLALSPDSPPGVESLLFGDILGPTDADLAAAGALVVLVAAVLPMLHARLLASGFNRGAAAAMGLSPGRWEAALMVLLAAAIVVAVQGLGNLLVVAVFVGPGAAARNLTDRVGAMIGVAAAIAMISGLAGLYLSYYAGTAGGASVALAIVTAYLFSLPAGRLLALSSRERQPAGATIG
jgi:ABC-type Mn2+/Zn2+ transport system permease subunit